MKVTFCLDMSAMKVGAAADEQELRGNNRKLLFLIEALVRCNGEYLDSHPETPSVYDAGVRYQQERETENWLDIPHVLKLGRGDCEDLASWRIAELRQQGVHAKGYLRWYSRPGYTLYHVLVLLPDGQLEDPSKALGMGGKA